MPGLSEYVEQIKELYNSLSMRQKIIAGVVTGVVMAGFAALFFFNNSVAMTTLYSDLDQGDASEVVAWLKKEGVQYEITQGGSAIRVPAEKVYDVRLALAGAGLPRGSGVGFEIFDKTNFGATDFVQRVNYQRALQGELEKTIAQFPQVKSVRVILAQPKETLFVRERQAPTASVVLNLKRGAEMSASQVKGIVHLVACAVPKLTRENVSVVDTSGAVMYEHYDNRDSLETRTRTQLLYKRRMEEYYKYKIQTMLDDALGPDKAVVRVSADIDFDAVESSEDRYDPDMTAIRSEQKLLEVEKKDEKGAIPGVKGGLANKLQGNLGQKNEDFTTRKQKDTKNWEISRLQRQVKGAVGKLSRLSVAVMVDGMTVNKDGKEEYKQRTPEEMASLERIVKAAMGYSAKRGDDVSVVNVAFTAPARSADVDRMVEIGSRFVKPAINLVLALLFIFMVVRPLLNRFVLKPEETVEELEASEQAVLAALEGETGEDEEAAVPFEPVPDPTAELQDLANDYPERAAALIKIWLREPAPDNQ
jgi:flagellar M-ring protein FliF